LVADDPELFREGLCRLLGLLDPSPFIIEAGDFDDALAVVERVADIGIVFLDLSMPGGPWGRALIRIRRSLPRTSAIVIVSGSEDPAHVRQALALGASGFVHKKSSAPTLFIALGVVMAGGTYVPDIPREDAERGEGGAPAAIDACTLTARQLDVLELLADGTSNRAIGKCINVREITVKLHVSQVLKKLNVKSRTQAAMLAVQFGLSRQRV